MKTWTFRQTEIRKPKNNTEIVDFEGFPTMVSELLYPHREYPILTLEVHDEDPMEPIKAVYERWEDADIDANPFLQRERGLKAWQAIEEYMKAVGK